MNPLDLSTIERALHLAGDGPILIALSGGGDSTALLHLLAEHLGAARVRAAVVDHGLRAGSAADAAKAAGFAAQLGVSADVLTLDWSSQYGLPAPSPAYVDVGRRGAGGPYRSQQALRRKRYAALSDFAREIGAHVIAAAHTADDQAETLFMRAAKGSAWRGLAGMPPLGPAPVWPEGRGIVLVRPVLLARRAALRAELRRRGAEWIEDPANANPAYERVRVRGHLAALEHAGFDPVRLPRLAEKLRALADAIDADARALIARAVRFEGDEILIDPAQWLSGEEARRRALSVLLAAAAGAEREPAAESVARLEARLAAPSFRGATLHGARVGKTSAGLRISRDPGALLGRAGGREALAAAGLSAGAELIWDGRLALVAARAGLRVIPAAHGPLIAAADDAAPLQAAVTGGAVTARWLMEQHVIHRLGPFSTTKAGSDARKPAAFTAP